MSDILKELEAYFLHTPQEEVVNDWNRLSTMYHCGPNVSTYVHEVMESTYQPKEMVPRVLSNDFRESSYDEHTKLGLTA